MVENDCGEIPVVDEKTRRLEGVVTDRDLVCRVLAADKLPGSVTAREAMSSPVVTVTPETTVEACCELMETNKIRRIPVVDRDGQCCGIGSQADVPRDAPRDGAGREGVTGRDHLRLCIEQHLKA
jgi:CBS domain-containing protein